MSDIPPAAPVRAPRHRPNILYQGLVLLASLRLTVVLFSLAIFLVFAGTLAQIDEGIWKVLDRYFRCAIAWIPVQVFIQFGQIFFNLPQSWSISRDVVFPFPGGWLIGGVMLVNLLAAHAVRFRYTWKHPGILLIHSGLIVIMIGEVIAGKMQSEGFMSIEEGESASFVDDNRHVELVFVDPSDPKFEEVTAIPQGLLRPGAIIRDPRLPVDVTVERFLGNSEVVDLDRAGKNFNNPATKGAGVTAAAIDVPETSGTSQKQTVDTPSAYVTFKDKTGKNLGTYLMSIYLNPQPLQANDRTYLVSLRFRRTHRPFSLQLLEFRFDRYVGTNTPKNFSSRVRLVDPEQGEDREVVIRMNEPLWHRGETFYQADWNKKTERGTVLQVVKNPGWLLPYISCVMVAVGMLVHFGMHLVGFLVRRRAAS